MKKFKEPKWNYQVIRFIDSNEKDIIPRKDRISTKSAVAKRMLETLEKAKRPVPPELQTLAESE